MTAKRVWGIVLIVLGVICAISGFQQIAEIAELDNLTRQFTGKVNLGNMSKQYEVASHNAKVGGMIKIVVGIMMALIGTWMVQDEETEKIDDSHFETEKNYDDWK
jgi:uncharacterized membrane protein YphA (DoxX/SURF4 family)